MENKEYEQFSKLVYDYCGLDYRNSLSTLAIKIQRRFAIVKTPSIFSYVEYVKKHSAEWQHIIECLTINETYFYREERQLHVYQQHVLQELLQHKSHINVWSAACSTGEEPYSLAILTKEANYLERVNFTATDINERVLQHGKNGRYNKRSLSFRRIPAHWISNHFEDQGLTYDIQATIKNHITFQAFNLLDAPNKWPKEQYDVIFCRNVLIYFDRETIQKVVQNFYDALKPGGYLFLGHAESISKYAIGFETIHKDGAFYYKK